MTKLIAIKAKPEINCYAVIESDATDFWDGKTMTINTGVGVPLYTKPTFAKRGFELRANPSNNGIIYVGMPDVATSGAICRRPLQAGESVFMPTAHGDSIYVTADTAGQTLHVFRF